MIDLNKLQSQDLERINPLIRGGKIVQKEPKDPADALLHRLIMRELSAENKNIIPLECKSPLFLSKDEVQEIEAVAARIVATVCPIYLYGRIRRLNLGLIQEA